MQYQPSRGIYACQSYRGLSFRATNFFDVSHMYLAGTEVPSLTTNPQILSGLSSIACILLQLPFQGSLRYTPSHLPLCISLTCRIAISPGEAKRISGIIIQK